MCRGGDREYFWANDHFPRGAFSDLKIFQSEKKSALDNNEFVVADGGYSDERCIKLDETASSTRLFAILRAV